MGRVLFREFLADLRAQKKRALLTSFAVVWGTVAVVVLLAFGEGLKVTAREGFLGAGEKIFKIYGGTTSLAHEGLAKGRRIRLREPDLALLQRSIPEIDAVSPSYGEGRTELARGDVKTTTYMEGVYPAFAELRNMHAAPGGRFLNERDLETRRRVLFLGDEIAVQLFGDEDPVGRRVRVDGLPFTVVGVMREKFQSSMSNGPDARRAVIPASTLRSIYGREHVNHLMVRPRSVAEAPRVKARIYETLGRRYRFDPADERALPMWDFIENEKQGQKIFTGIQIFLGLVGLFTLLVAGIGVANIMYVLVRERTNEIGLKLAVGARRRHVVGQFVFEAVMITLLGGLVGLALAAGIVLAVDAVPVESVGLQYIMNPKLSWPIALTAVSVLAAIGLTAGILPARKAAALDPVESLRYE